MKTALSMTLRAKLFRPAHAMSVGVENPPSLHVHVSSHEAKSDTKVIVLRV